MTTSHTDGDASRHEDVAMAAYMRAHFGVESVDPAVGSEGEPDDLNEDECLAVYLRRYFRIPLTA